MSKRTMYLLAITAVLMIAVGYRVASDHNESQRIIREEAKKYEEHAAKALQKLSVQSHIAAWADSYGMAKRNGDWVRACVHAGVVVQAYLAEKREKDYLRWREVESEACGNAGVPVR